MVCQGMHIELHDKLAKDFDKTALESDFQPLSEEKWVVFRTGRNSTGEEDEANSLEPNAC